MYIYAYTHKKIYKQIRQNIIRIFVPQQWEFERFILVLFTIAIWVFSKFCSINLYYFCKDKSYFFGGRKVREQIRNLHLKVPECSKCLKSNSFPPLHGKKAEPPKSEKCGQLCPLPSTFGKCPVILDLLSASISCGHCVLWNYKLLSSLFRQH